MILNTLHGEYQLIHTDLKPENILISNPDDLKLIEAPSINLALPQQFLDCKWKLNGSRRQNVSRINATAPYTIPIDFEITLIDFGGACLPEDSHDGIINTR